MSDPATPSQPAEPAPSAKSKFAKLRKDGGNGVLAFIAHFLQQIGSLAIILLAARFLSPSEYGVYSIATIFLLFLQEMTFAGVTQYIVTQKGDEKALLATTFWLIVGFSLVGSVLLFAFAPLIAYGFDAPQLSSTIQLLALAQPVAAYTAWAGAVLMRRKKLRQHFLLLGLQNLIALVCGIATLFVWQSIFALVAYRYYRTFSGMVAYLIFVREWPGLRFDKVLGKQLFAFSSHLYGTRFLQFFSNYGADLMLGATMSTASAGLYRLGNRIAMVPIELIGQPVRTFALAQFGDTHRNDRPFSPLAAAFVSSMTFVMGGIGATVSIFGKELVTYLFQPAYLAALPITMALIVRSILGIGDSLLEPVLASVGKTKLIFWHRTFWALVVVAGMFAAAPFGAPAVAWTLAGIMFFASAVTFRHFWRYCDVHPSTVFGAIAKALGLVGIYYAGAWAIHYELAEEVTRNLAGTLLISLGGCAILGLALAGVALKTRVLVLGIFSGK